VQVVETVEDRLRPSGLSGPGGRQREDRGAADDCPAVSAASRLLSVRTKLCCRGMVRDLHRSAGRRFKGCECCKSRLHPLDINIGHFFQIYKGIARHLIDSNQLVQFQLHRLGVATLGILDHEHHQEGNDRGTGVDDQLPSVGPAEKRAGNCPK